MRYFAAVLVALLGCSSASAGIINGDFETGDLTGWTYGNTKNLGTLEVEPDPDGGYYAALRFSIVPVLKMGGARITQTFTIDARSDVSFSLLGEIDTDSDAVHASHAFDALSGGIVSHPEDYESLTILNTSVNGTLTYRVEAGTYRFELLLGSAPIGNAGTYAEGFLILDDISIVEVPEPASLLLALCAIGLGSLHSRFFSKRLSSRR